MELHIILIKCMLLLQTAGTKKGAVEAPFSTEIMLDVPSPLQRCAALPD
jgi:hypothetical protein